MLSRSLCRSWGLHWLSGVKLRAYDGSMMGVSARMMGVHRFNVLCAFCCFARYYITAGCAVLCPQSAGFAPPQTPPKADRHTTPAPLACRIFELSLCGWAGILHCGWAGILHAAYAVARCALPPQPLAHLNARLNARLIGTADSVCVRRRRRMPTKHMGGDVAACGEATPCSSSDVGGHPLLGISQPYFGLPI